MCCYLVDFDGAPEIPSWGVPSDDSKAQGLKTDLVAGFVSEEINLLMLQDVVNWQMAKRRSGTAQAKVVAEVAATKAKPWRQKGTGRARHGSLVGPQFRGGAVVFGPRHRDFSYSLNKKLRRGALKMALSLKINLGFFSISRGVVVEKPKTKDFVTKINNYIGRKSLLYCVPRLNEALVLACRNVPGVLVVTADGLNVRDILRSDVIVIDRDAVDDVLRRVA